MPPAGIQESSNVFSQFGSLHDRETAENRIQSGRTSASVTDSFQGVGSSGADVRHAETSSGAKKKSSSKKNKAQQERISFDECVRDVSFGEVCDPK